MPTVNIDSKGYGKIYKSIMRNRKLPLLAKVIYAYFCAYAGNGITAFPKRDKIIRDLQINKDTYTKYLRTLVTDGYIAKERTANGNLYTIIQTVPAYQSQQTDANEMTDMLVFENIKAQGFGTVPKLVMLDQRLTAQAKALYAYFASFAGAGTTAFPRRSTVMRELGLTVNTYYTHLRLLLEAGYLSVEQRKSNGKFDVSIYRLADHIELTANTTPSNRGMCEKAIHVKNSAVETNIEPLANTQPPMSEELLHGGKMLKTPVSMSEKVMSEEPLSEKVIYGNFGHANIKNSNITNSSHNKEQEYNHQAAQPDETAPTFEHTYTLLWVKEHMNFDFLRREATALSTLKETLGHFTDVKEDKAHFQKIANEILNQMAKQIHRQINKSEHQQHILTALSDGALRQLFDDIMEQWREIRCVEPYVEAAINNIQKIYICNCN